MNYVFIGGVPRSGTTMLQKILANHPQIIAGPEFDHIPNIMSLYAGMKGGIKNGRQVFFYDESFLSKQFNAFIGSLFSNLNTENKSYICEKTPSNGLYLKDLLEINKDFKLVFLIRDPRGIAASMKEVYKRAKKDGIKAGISKKINKNLKLIDSYYKSLNAALEFDKQRIYILHYEDILEKPDENIKGLLNYLSLDFYPEILDTAKENIEIKDIEKNRSTSSWYSKEKFIRPISKDGIDSWKSSLSKMESNYIERYYLYRNNPFLKEYNYQKKSNLSDLWQKVLYKIYKP